ncbi:calmodulin [Elysia marginata]|uniref:Calmodulin n=1 Tax=Elysia marginata TaxID=1093978 RepID=A0AAV4EPW3_9GAST|nr:calmodulin [Elysia marginata]
MAGKKSISEWEAVFRAADKDGSGTLDVHELRDMLRKANCNISDSQIGEAFVYLHGPHGDKCTLEEFVKGMQKLEEFIKGLVRLFREYDADNSGYLDKNELRKIMESCGHKYTEKEIQETLQKADTSGDGKISFDEFFNACT